RQAGDQARGTLDSTGQRLREMTAGDQVQGTLVGVGRSELDVRPAAEPSASVETVHTDAQTRWILRGATAGRDGFPIGSIVRITYIVKNGRRIATQVEAVAP
ncbi:MAG TPA: hypothetical protein VFE93_09320, partial [Myxococcaceae bacterium]|nr:hypothetical protein [Myxococcaceae bacterium]